MKNGRHKTYPFCGWYKEHTNSPNLIHNDMHRIMILVPRPGLFTTMLLLEESTLNGIGEGCNEE